MSNLDLSDPCSYCGGAEGRFAALCEHCYDLHERGILRECYYCDDVMSIYERGVILQQYKHKDFYYDHLRSEHYNEAKCRFCNELLDNDDHRLFHRLVFHPETIENKEKIICDEYTIRCSKCKCWFPIKDNGSDRGFEHHDCIFEMWDNDLYKYTLDKHICKKEIEEMERKER